MENQPIVITAEQGNHLLAAAVVNPTVPKVYMQSFANLASPVDVTVIAMTGGVPAGVVSFSYPVAKVLARMLAEAVATYERLTDNPILAADEAAERMQKHMTAQSK